MRDKVITMDTGGIDISQYVKTTGTRMTGRINMGGKLIKKKKKKKKGEGTDSDDAITKGAVDSLTHYLNERKVNKSGDFMTGNLKMGGNKVVNVGIPTDNKDVATKEYVDDLVGMSLHAVGRYIVFFNEADKTKTYFSVRAEKNVDLNSGLWVELQNNIDKLVIPEDVVTQFSLG